MDYCWDWQTENKTVKPTVHKISVSKEPDENKFQFQGEELGGASGSPIVDEKEHKVSRSFIWWVYSRCDVWVGLQYKTFERII